MVDEIDHITATEDSSRQYLFDKGILKSSMICACSTPMVLTPCSATKSTDQHIWKCPQCKKFKNIRSESVLSGAKLLMKQFLTLVFYFSIKSLTNIEIAAVTGISDKTVGMWRCVIADAEAEWFLNNAEPLGGPGCVVEIDEAKFGKRKYNKGAYREGMWVLGGVDRNSGNCFLVPCP